MANGYTEHFLAGSFSLFIDIYITLITGNGTL